MAIIKINNLNTAGYDLFNDSESYLTELTDSELNMTQGGSSPWCAYWLFIGSVAVLNVTLALYQARRK